MQNNKKLAIIGAMDCEINTLRQILSDVEEVKYSDLDIFLGRFSSYQIILAKSGVGKVNAALNTQYIIDHFSPDYIINSGVAGGIGKELEVGDIVIANRLVHHDFDATALGYAKGYICNGIEPTKPTYFYSDKKMIEAFMNIVQEFKEVSNVHVGTIATGDMFVSSMEKKDELRELFDATACEMEGAAIAQTATKNCVPFVIVRAISDLADCSAPRSLDEVETTMAEFAATVTERLLNSHIL